MKVKAVVPIKLNNERFPNKNVALLDGKPLCTYLLNTLSKIDGLETYVYCSDEAIIPYLPDNINFFKRDARLDNFSVKRQDIVSTMIRDISADVYLYAHVTNPFLTKESIDKAIRSITNGDYDSAIGVTSHRKYIWYKNEPMNFERNNLLRTQDIEPVYMEMGLYAFKREVALQNGSVYGDKLCLIPVSDIEAVDIDYKEDLDFASLIIKQRQ